MNLQIERPWLSILDYYVRGVNAKKASGSVWDNLLKVTRLLSYRSTDRLILDCDGKKFSE